MLVKMLFTTDKKKARKLLQDDNGRLPRNGCRIHLKKMRILEGRFGEKENIIKTITG